MLHRLENTCGNVALVRRSANCFEDGMNWNVTTFFVQASLKNDSQPQLFGPFIEYAILGNVDGRLIITTHRHGSRLSET